MAVEYLFVGAIVTFVTGLSFTILGVETEFPLKIYYLFAAMISTFLCGYMLLATDVAMMIPLMWFFWFLGIMDFIMIIVFSFKALEVRRTRKRGWPEPDQ